ncbi:protein LNK1-like isoform X2 [Chenopodium quinoa]|uniref:protein LNK1-like isoform X2 n=1 Tax=Chenopodium quinoa TaxID=63459 RepID=UPI000B782E70|nr:protein LNK1-like isoform X2 [Chenopodium quinoa]
MSDSRIYELEDIVWELGDNDDHIVPQPGGKRSGFSLESDSSKSQRLQLRCAVNNADNRSASGNVIHRKEGTHFCSVKEEKEKMMDNSPRTHSSSGGLSASLDGECNGKIKRSPSDEERTFEHCMTSSNMDPTGDGICVGDPVLEERAASMDNNLYQYELNNATHAESGLDFFGNNLDDKESNDLLYYQWSEIENFEDVDRMFRNCDSTFGLDIDNNVELGWFPTSHAMEGSDDAIKPSFNFSDCSTTGLDGVTEQQEVFGMNNGLVADESDEKLTVVDCKRVSEKLTANGPSTVLHSSNVNGSSVISSIDNESQIQSGISQPKHQKPSEGKRKERPSDNIVSFIQFDSLNQAVESNHSLNFQCNQSSENSQQKEASHCTSAQIPIPLVNPNDSRFTNQGLQSTASSIIKSEDGGLPSVPLKRSSYASNQMQSVERAHDVALQNPSTPRNKKKDRPFQSKLSGHPEKGNLMVEKADSDPICVQKLCDLENEAEGQSEVDDEAGIATELDSSNIQESSCMSSVLDEVSIDASSFQQLQNVMEKLDVRTKMCIRDSLYRLARSAERRHKCVNPIGGDKDDKDTSGAFLSDGTNKCTGFMDMETDTNPIDRSIAHLLFHRPSDPSATAPLDALPVKAHTMGQARSHGPLIAEKPAFREETTSANGEAAEH